MKELVIIPPEGFEVDKEHSTFEKIVFKPIDSKPRSWKEYVFTSNVHPFLLGYDIHTGYMQAQDKQSEYPHDYCAVPSKEYAKSFLALMQLISLRQAWIGEWKPDWNNSTNKFVIQYEHNKLLVDSWKCMSRPLSFPTREMAQEFFDCFKDLLEQAKPLI